MRWLVAVTLAFALFGCTKNNNAFKNCGLPHEQVYDRQTNPRGARCTAQAAPVPRSLR